MRANIAGDFVTLMYDSADGRFNAGSVPVGTPPSAGVCPYGPQKGNDVINICDFVDSNTFTTLALAATQRYSNQINWQLPINYVWTVFPQSVMVDGLTFSGLDRVLRRPLALPALLGSSRVSPSKPASMLTASLVHRHVALSGSSILGRSAWRKPRRLLRMVSAL